jgi:hypothetical protein
VVLVEFRDQWQICTVLSKTIWVLQCSGFSVSSFGRL